VRSDFQDSDGIIMGEFGFQWVFVWISWSTMVELWGGKPRQTALIHGLFGWPKLWINMLKTNLGESRARVDDGGSAHDDRAARRHR
jgi:hypothetical protein